MISTGINDLKRWNLRDRKYAKENFLTGKSLELIGKECNRHAKNVCIELMRQGLIDEKNNISKNHIRFETDSDTCSEYYPSASEEDSEDDDYADEEEESVEGEGDEYTDEDEEDEDYVDEGEDDEYTDEDEEDEEEEYIEGEDDAYSDEDYVDEEDFDIYNIHQNIENIYKMVDGLKNYISNIRRKV